MERVWAVSVSYGELILKGKNRWRFIQKVEKRIKKALEEITVLDFSEEFGKLFIEVTEEEVDLAVEALKKVFGVVYITPCLKTNRKREDILEQMLFLLDRENFKGSFKIKAKRSDKNFPVTSPEICQLLGGDLLKKRPDLSVDVHQPDLEILVEIRDSAYVSIHKVKGMGGLPSATGGRGLLLLSGGIDSPVAGISMARRGMEIACLHFHSYPFSSERAKDKSLRLAKKMSVFTGDMDLFMVNLADSYVSMNEKCEQKNITILARRMMMRIGEKICKDYGLQAMITGESLGQVASQTVEGIQVVNDATKTLILRPLIAWDKTEIIEKASLYDTFETAIEPYDDCCSIFAPDRPNIKPRLEDILKEEEKIDIEELMEKAFDSLEVIAIKEDE